MKPDRARSLGDAAKDANTSACCCCGSEVYAEDILTVGCEGQAQTVDLCEGCYEEYEQEHGTMDSDMLPKAEFDALQMWARRELILAFIPASEQINDEQDVNEFFDALTAFVNWHPDNDFADYVKQPSGKDADKVHYQASDTERTFSDEEAGLLNECMQKCFQVCERVSKRRVDVYDLSIASLRRVQPEFCKAVMAEPPTPERLANGGCEDCNHVQAKLVYAGGVRRTYECGCEIKGNGSLGAPWHIHKCAVHDAAPELLATAKAALKYLEANRPKGSIRKIFAQLNEHENAIVKPLRAAIAEAEGRGQ